MSIGRRIFAFFLTTLFVFSLFAGSAVYAENNYEHGIDAIMVLDISGSMIDNDPEYLGLTAAHLFVDKLDKEQDEVALVTFSTETNVLTEGFVSMNESGNIDYLHALIDGIKYIPHGYTDTGYALEAAYDRISESLSREDSNPFIVLVSDGKYDGPYPRTEAVIAESVNATVEKCAAAGVPVYTIYLEEVATVIDKTKAMNQLKSIAEDTNGLFAKADYSEDLPDIIGEMLAKHREGTTDHHGPIRLSEEWQDVPLLIDDDFLSRIGITIMTESVIDFKITDPTGTNIDPRTYKDAYYNEEEGYYIIQLARPMMGEWTVSVKQSEDARKTVDEVVYFTFESSFGDVEPVLQFEDQLHSTDGKIEFVMDAKVVASKPIDLGKPFMDNAGDVDYYEVDKNDNLMYFADSNSKDFTVKVHLTKDSVLLSDESAFTNVESVTLTYRYNGGEHIEEMDMIEKDGATVGFQKTFSVPFNDAESGIADYEFIECTVNHANFTRECTGFNVAVDVVNVPGYEPVKDTRLIKQMIPMFIGLLVLIILLAWVVYEKIKSAGLWSLKPNTVMLKLKVSLKAGISAAKTFELNIDKRFNYMSMYKAIQKYSSSSVPGDSGKDLLDQIDKEIKKQLHRIIIAPENGGVRFNARSKAPIININQVEGAYKGMDKYGIIVGDRNDAKVVMRSSGLEIEIVESR